MTELPWLDNLIWFPDSAADHGYRVFKGDTVNWGVKELANETQCLLLLSLFARKPSGTTDGKMRAGRMRDHQVPSSSEDRQNVTFKMGSWRLARQQITGPRIVALRNKGIADDAGKFTGNEDVYRVTPIRAMRRMTAMMVTA
jgi:hypothetical protein